MASNSQGKVCYELKNKGKCERANCKFSHELNVVAAVSPKDPPKHPPKQIPDGIVLFGNEPIPKPSSAKGKKPKHLKRKLQIAEETGDAELLSKCEEESKRLLKVKADSAKLFKKTCRRLVIKMHGEEAWEKSDFDALVAAGVKGPALLEKLKISLEDQAKFEENE